MRAELLAVIGDNPGRLLAAMLQSVKAERRQRRRVGVAIHPEHAAFLVKMIRVQDIGRQAVNRLRIGRGHRRSLSRSPLHNSFIKEMPVGAAQSCYRVLLISRSMSLRSPDL